MDVESHKCLKCKKDIESKLYFCPECDQIDSSSKWKYVLKHYDDIDRIIYYLNSIKNETT